jgi:hypothetical protein
VLTEANAGARTIESFVLGRNRKTEPLNFSAEEKFSRRGAVKSNSSGLQRLAECIAVSMSISGKAPGTRWHPGAEAVSEWPAQRTVAHRAEQTGATTRHNIRHGAITARPALTKSRTDFRVMARRYDQLRMSSRAAPLLNCNHSIQSTSLMCCSK